MYCSVLCDCAGRLMTSIVETLDPQGAYFLDGLDFLGRCARKNTHFEAIRTEEKRSYFLVSVSHWSRLHPERVDSIML